MTQFFVTRKHQNLQRDQPLGFWMMHCAGDRCRFTKKKRFLDWLGVCEFVMICHDRFVLRWLS